MEQWPVCIYGKYPLGPARGLDITRDCLKKTLPEKNFSDQPKLLDAYAAAYGTTLFYEDQVVVKDFQNKYPQYEDSFPIWSQEASATHQFAVWNVLCDAGFGASLQHYNPTIDKAVATAFGLSPEWKLTGQMPFGAPADKPAKKDFAPLNTRAVMFK